MNTNLSPSLPPPHTHTPPTVKSGYVKREKISFLLLL